MRNDRHGEFRISRESWLRRSVSECRVIINQRVVLFIGGNKMSKGLFKCGTLARGWGRHGGWIHAERCTQRTCHSVLTFRSRCAFPDPRVFVSRFQLRPDRRLIRREWADRDVWRVRIINQHRAQLITGLRVSSRPCRPVKHAFVHAKRVLTDEK